jgi:hypothetical protein
MFKKLRSDDNEKMKKKFDLKTDLNISNYNNKIITPA